MPPLTPRTTPGPEYVTWDGSNDGDVLDLVERVAALDVWSPLSHGPFTVEVRDNEDEPHLGLNVVNSLGQTVARVERGNSLVFHLFRPGDDPTPLFVMAPHELDAFYGTG